jgi:hypothetical protein
MFRALLQAGPRGISHASRYPPEVIDRLSICRWFTANGVGCSSQARVYGGRPMARGNCPQFCEVEAHEKSAYDGLA